MFTTVAGGMYTHPPIALLHVPLRATDGLAALMLLYKQTIIYNCSHIAFSIACVGIGIYVIEGMINNSFRPAGEEWFNL